MEISIKIIAFFLGTGCYSQMMMRGEYKLDVMESRNCPKIGTNEIQFNWKVRKIGLDKRELYGNLTLLKPLDHNVAVNVYIQEWDPKNGWKPNYSFANNDACSALYSALPDLFSVIKANRRNNTLKMACPLKKGVFTQDGFPSDYLSDIQLPGAWPGKYKVRLSFLSPTDKRLIGCYLFIAMATRK